MDSQKQLLLNLLQEGSTPISNLLLSTYRQIGLTDQEMMLIIHLLHFQSKGDHFPSISQLEQRMSIKTEEIMRLLQRLVKQRYIYIEEKKEEKTGILYEKYNLTPLFLKIIKELERNYQMEQIEQHEQENKDQVRNMYQLFEKEFGRPLSPMEIELLTTWLDEDKYSDEMMIYALKEAVYSGKLNFRYIDRILFEWHKKNIRTAEQIKQHVKNFRLHQETDKKGKAASDPNFEFYNWLENE